MELLNISQAAKVLGLLHGTLSYHIHANNIPKPTHQKGVKFYYTVEEVEKLRQYFVQGVSVRRSTGLLNLTETAALAGITGTILRRLIQDGKVTGGVPIGRRWFFRKKDILKIKQAGKRRAMRPGESRYADAEDNGFYSIVRMATILRMPDITLAYMLARDRLPCRPNHVYKGKKYFNQADLITLRSWLKDHYTPKLSNRKHSY